MCRLRMNNGHFVFTLIVAMTFSCEFGQGKISLPNQKSSSMKNEVTASVPSAPLTPGSQQQSASSVTPSSTSGSPENQALSNNDGKQAEVSATTVPTPHSPPVVAANLPENSKNELRLSGAVAAPRRSALTFKVGGFIKSISAKPGDRLKTGDILAVLEQPDYELRYKLAVARRDQAKVALDTAKKDFKREQELKTADATTSMSFDKITAAHQAAELNYKMAELDLSIAQKALNDTKLVAPYDCIVAHQYKYAGEQVGPGGGNVFEVYDTAPPEISLSAPEKLMGKIKTGDELTISIPAIQYSEIAQVIRVVPAISNTTRTFEVVAQFSKADERVVPGHFAEAVVKIK